LADATKGEEKPPVLAAVVVNWNRPADTLACLESLHEARPRPSYVVVVDNGSIDDSVERIINWARQRGIEERVAPPGGEGAAYAPRWLTVIKSAENRGFSGGNNLGVDYLLGNTDSTHWLLLNNDATVKEDFLTHIAEVIRSTSDAGLITGTIYHDSDRQRVWYAGGREVPYRALVEHLHHVPDDGAAKPTGFVTGCAMVVSARLRERIGSLPECYFPGYSEDVEYSRRAREAGFSLIYAPLAVAYHKVGATAGAASESPSVLQAQMRHRVYYVRRNFRGLERQVALAYLAATKPAKALLETLKGRPRLGLAVLRGTIEGFMNRV